MKKYIIVIICILLCTALVACGQENADLVGIIFERGNGSVWGNQFYIEVNTDEIVVARYIPEGSSEQVTIEHIPVAAEQWQILTETIQNLSLKKERGLWKEKLFGSSKLDGGEYRKLTLVWKRASGEQEVDYQWPANEQANSFEQLLEQVAQAGK